MGKTLFNDFLLKAETFIGNCGETEKLPDNQAAIEAQRLLHQNPLLVDKLIAFQVVASVKEAGQAMTELVKFLYLCSDSQVVLTPSRRVDDTWHEFILFTRAYEGFCLEYLTRFIHHQPSRDPDREFSQYQYTLALYRKKYGDPVPEFWCDAGVCKNHCGTCEN